MDDPSEFLSPFLLLWLFFGYLELSIWMQIITSVRKTKSKQSIRITLFCIFVFLSFIEFLTFNQIIRTSQRYDFGFWLSIFFPTIFVYFVIGRLIYGIYRSLRHKFLRNRSLRTFKKYHLCIPLIELTFSFAYSSFVGIFTSIINFVAIYYVDRSIPKRKKVRKQRKQV
ncbi:hypothetical protein M9Y10_009454 [Tritrichomonas musculus]|uniref:Uncharacterized protein n=1 Tax=Tritrichomonas musculus TaxID=1915356 RepID=A0ABR2IPL5_9EUKA